MITVTETQSLIENNIPNVNNHVDIQMLIFCIMFVFICCLMFTFFFYNLFKKHGCNFPFIRRLNNAGSLI